MPNLIHSIIKGGRTFPYNGREYLPTQPVADCTAVVKSPVSAVDIRLDQLASRLMLYHDSATGPSLRIAPKGVASVGWVIGVFLDDIEPNWL